MSDQHDEKCSDGAGLFGSGSSGTSGLGARRGGGGHVSVASRANPRVKLSDVAKLEAARRAKLKKKITDRFIAKSAQQISDLVDGWDEKTLDSIEAGIEAGAVTIDVFKDGIKAGSLPDLKAAPIGSRLSTKAINAVIEEVFASHEELKGVPVSGFPEEVEAAFERKSQSTTARRGPRTF